MRIATVSLWVGALLVASAGNARADVIQPWNEVPSGLCPEGSRQSAHSGSCIVRQCDRSAPGARCARVSLCVTSVEGRVAGVPHLVAHRTCREASDCPPVSDCRTLDVVPGRDPPVVQALLGCCTLALVAAAAGALLFARARVRARRAREEPSSRDVASASRDARVG